ncbi:hypothetical protein NE857_33815 (plasmid) [Nocardiopsis exhalans]|uniref:DUF4142 domain-containing protein n=1 Tax=Nocardiopsis exhalans TaxID=163604 RepID=A0ABY5DGZ0_9ACTN|nr:hypothetical protein [Nocardiopsis exhalans]USY23609.1 hypothetical protein NE857_33815 [Nocardiopsis exhalans]
MPNAQQMDQAREIAADFHNGQTSALYAFASGSQVTDRDQARAEIRACERQADPAQRARLDTLRAAIDQQADAQQRQILADILRAPKPEVWSLDHTQPGALEADRAHVTAMIERAARELEFPAYAGFVAHLGIHLDRMATAYHAPKAVRKALQAHADQELERINDQD